MLQRRVVVLVILAMGAVVTWAAPGRAHGLLESATPAPDARVSNIPRVVEVSLSQPPLPGGRLMVRDGCGRIVNEDSKVEEATITTEVESAEPGQWRVGFDFVSATDGHRYARTYSFVVTGKRDCDREEKSDGPAEASYAASPQGGMRPASPEAGMKSAERVEHVSGGPDVPMGLLVASSVIALVIGLVSRVRPRGLR
jgi:methionine-rich copper-binding protein CopC